MRRSTCALKDLFMRTHHNGNCLPVYKDSRCINVCNLWSIEKKKIKVDCESVGFDDGFARPRRRGASSASLLKLIRFGRVRAPLRSVLTVLMQILMKLPLQTRIVPVLNGGFDHLWKWTPSCPKLEIASGSRYFWRPKLSSAARARESNFFYFLRILKETKEATKKLGLRRSRDAWIFSSPSPYFYW